MSKLGKRKGMTDISHSILKICQRHAASIRCSTVLCLKYKDKVCFSYMKNCSEDHLWRNFGNFRKSWVVARMFAHADPWVAFRLSCSTYAYLDICLGKITWRAVFCCIRHILRSSEEDFFLCSTHDVGSVA